MRNGTSSAANSPSKKVYRLIVAWALIGIFFIISVAGLLYEPFEEMSAKIANRNYNGEGLIEWIEAACWLSAFCIFARLLFQKYHDRAIRMWFAFFLIFTFVAFGEEISWGQHIFGFDPPDSVKAINVQNEFNFHNLHLSKLLGISEDDFLYRYTRNLTSILNPLFYLICSLLWVVFPLMKKVTRFRAIKILSAMPSPSLGTVIFCAFNIMLYLIVDKLLFDIGEIFELALSLVAILFAWDIWSEKKAVHQSSETMVEAP